MRRRCTDEQCCYRRRLFFVGRKAAASVLRAGNGFCNSGRAEAVPLPQVALAGGTPVPPPYSYAPASIAPMVLRPSAHAMNILEDRRKGERAVAARSHSFTSCRRSGCQVVIVVGLVHKEWIAGEVAALQCAGLVGL